MPRLLTRLPPLLEPLESRKLLFGRIEGVVWDDLDGDSLRDAGEPGLNKQLIYIDANSNGTFNLGDRSVLTGADGSFSFGKFSPGTYEVRYNLPGGRRLTAPSSIFQSVTIVGDETVSNRNFASSTMAVLRGKVFADVNSNGAADAGETGLAGWRVFIDKDNDGIFDAATERYRLTNNLGEYRFANLAPGRYVIRIEHQALFTLTNPRGGGFTINVAPAQTFSNRNFFEHARGSS
jgi:hypothetical protein